jgi:DegV family protein with EDD domain
VSSEVSGTYNAALNARDLVPGREIVVIDSRSISMAQGFMALEAKAVADAGGTLDEVVAAAQGVGTRATLYGALATLKYLAMSGRVGHLAAGMASLLAIKPILTLRDGKLDMLEKVRTRSKSLARLVDLTVQSLDGRSVEKLAILNVTAAEEAKKLESLLRAALDCPEEVVHAEFTAGLSVHTGPGTVGVVAVASEGA